MGQQYGWWEEYRCGCVTETVKRKRDLLGYCPRHGDSRRYAHAHAEAGEVKQPDIEERMTPDEIPLYHQNLDEKP